MDIVVTVPKRFGLDTWIAEGDPAGVPWSGQEWHFYLGGILPQMKPGERVYVVYNGALRGYAPLVRIDQFGWRYGLVRHDGAVAVSIAEYIPGFRGFRYRWWKRDVEQPFPNWKDSQAALFDRAAFTKHPLPGQLGLSQIEKRKQKGELAMPPGEQITITNDDGSVTIIGTMVPSTEAPESEELQYGLQPLEEEVE